MPKFIIDCVSEEGNAFGSVRPSVRPFVSALSLSSELSDLSMCTSHDHSWPRIIEGQGRRSKRSRCDLE